MLAAFELQQRLKLQLWQRGIEPCGASGCAAGTTAIETGLQARWLAHRADPILRMRGGADGCAGTSCEPVAVDLDALRDELGAEFAAALHRNEQDHEADCELSCRHFYCGAGDGAFNTSTVRSYSLGPLAPEDFASDFEFPLDLIKVTSEPLIAPEEAEEVVALATEDGVYDHEFPSGKYRLGGDWVKSLPNTLEWFNERLRTTIFPAVAALFPEVVSDASVLRAHSVAILKYNSSHPRTDVHIDDGILALTLALSPRANYTGGGTYYEHMDEVLPMEQGHCTIRPGSVRHGGHPVTEGDRYILGGFLLLADRVEHVRRLVVQGSAARGRSDYVGARQLFAWALAINPQCARCLKNWAEALSADPAAGPAELAEAEEKLARSLELLPDDSDGWFSLGRVRSDRGDADGAIAAYKRSAQINADDHELCFNLAVLLGDQGDADAEIEWLQQTLKVKPDFSKAWSNLGVAFASRGDLDSAEHPFAEAVRHDPLDHKGWVNLARLHAAKGRPDEAKAAAARAKEVKAG